MQKRDHTKLICDISELSGLFEDASSLEAFLQKTVEMIAEHMHSDVCSVYLYNAQDRELVLKATRGLKATAIGEVKLSWGEGLTGIALKEMRPICEQNASSNPGYRYFPEIGEEAYESFLAVPITRGQTRIGVIVVQNAKKNYFNEEDIQTLRAVTSQLANIIETTKMLMDLNVQEKGVKKNADLSSPKLIKGKVGSKGLAFGQAIVWEDVPGYWDRRTDGNGIIYSLEEFHRAVEATERQLEDMQQEIETALSDVASLIFTAQILMLKDQTFIGSIEKLIKEEGYDAGGALVQVMKKYADMFDRLEHPHLREKKQDIRDVGKRILDNLRGACEIRTEYKNKVIIARELLPSEILKISSQGVAGLVLLSGGVTSHLSILARSLQIPLIIAEEESLMSLSSESFVLLDAEQGNIYLDPAQDVIDSFREKEKKQKEALSLKDSVKDRTRTADGIEVQLLANINLLNDLKLAREFKAEGIGLYRTEFPFIVRSDFPSEEEQYIVYKKLVEGLPGKEITFRTLDIGGDKVLSYYHHNKEENPFLGMRSIRFSLKHKDIFAQQLRAILRAGHDADLRIMFPMISSLDEFSEAKDVLNECLKDLQKSKIICHKSPKIGMMVELPAVLEIIDVLAQEVDFFSIGTNDFIQYMLAVDRTNEKVSEHYLPEHPAVLRALKKIVGAAQKHHKEVTICGDMAHEVRYIPYLLGIGIRKLSLDPCFIPLIQGFIESLNLQAVEKKTQQLLVQDRIQDILQMME